MSTSDSNNDELNNEYDDYANYEAEAPLDDQAADDSAYTDESYADESYADESYAEGSTEDAYSDAGEYVDPNDYADSGEYSEQDAGEYADVADSSEYSEDAYAPLDGEAYSENAYAEEPIEEVRKEYYHPPVMNRYNVILLVSLLILLLGIILVLIRLADYKFNVRAKQPDSGFTSIEYVLPMTDAETSVIKNV